MNRICTRSESEPKKSSSIWLLRQFSEIFEFAKKFDNFYGFAFVSFICLCLDLFVELLEYRIWIQCAWNFWMQSGKFRVLDLKIVFKFFNCIVLTKKFLIIIQLNVFIAVYKIIKFLTDINPRFFWNFPIIEF
jgi:hypothetical protein